MGFGERLSSLIEENGMNNLSLSKEIGTSDSLIGNWRKEKKLPSFEKLLLLADFFGVTLDYLCFRSNERTDDIEKAPISEKISKNGRRMLELFENLPAEKQTLMIGYIMGMSSIPPVDEPEPPAPASSDERAG